MKYRIAPDYEEQVRRLGQIVNISDGVAAGDWHSVEDTNRLRRRFQNRSSLIITDDNMGLEWR